MFEISSVYLLFFNAHANLMDVLISLFNGHYLNMHALYFFLPWIYTFIAVSCTTINQSKTLVKKNIWLKT